MTGITFKVEGMKCGGCRSKIEEAMKNLDSSISTTIDLEAKTVAVDFEDQSPLDLKKTIEEAGFSVSGMETN